MIQLISYTGIFTFLPFIKKKPNQTNNKKNKQKNPNNNKKASKNPTAKNKDHEDN